MNQKIIACPTRNDLLEFLSTELDDDHACLTEAHLSDCTQCRQRLETLSASSEVWDEARESLTPRDNEFLATRHYPQVGNSIAHDAIETLGPVDESAYLNILGPTDDPNMMGRIGSYEVVGVVGRGGMGVVFKAYDAPLNRFVAIKMLLPHLAVSASARQRFAREGQAAAAVIDDNVTPIYNVAQWKEIPYLVTQYCSGVTLRKRIADRGPLTLKEVLRIGMQTAKGLTAAHAQGLVHRDVKPSNILLDGEVERAMLTDFGLARAVDDASITRTGVITGTPQYMSPEQARGDSIDARSDLFSLGSTLYAMCAGRPPFRSESAYGVMHRITHEEPTPICEVNSDVPPWMGTIIERLMSKTAEDRFQSAEEVAELMEGCLAHVQQPTTTKLPETLASTGSDRGGSSSWGKWLAIVGFAFFFVLGGILLVIELNKGKLVIECAADNVPVRIMQGDIPVKQLTVSKEGATVKIAAGNYLVEVDGDSDDIAVEGNTVSISRGGVETVKIQLKADAASVAGGWTPPENPVPSKILAEAADDRKSGEYQRALAKHLWYYENAVRTNSTALMGSALTDWLELGEEYPPALVKMREVRDALEDSLRDKKRIPVEFKDFHYFTAFNRTLREYKRTANLFKWFDEVNPKAAERLYGVSEPALVKQQEYATCGKYINPTFDVKKICFRYEEDLIRSSKSRMSQHLIHYGEQNFISEGTTLVEILVNVDRKPEAKIVAEHLKKHVEGKEIAAQLEKAMVSAMEKKPLIEKTKVPAENNVKEMSQAEVEAAKDHPQLAADPNGANWTPPVDPDPKKILDEARADTDSGNYPRALAKHLWYHDNAVQIRRGQSGVRRSHAMRDWKALGEKYPPALAKMQAIRDALEVKMRDKTRVRVNSDDFQDFEAFNCKLRQEQRTVKLFKWLDGVGSEDAELLYGVSEDALMLEQEYEICSKYVDPFKNVKQIIFMYKMTSKLTSKSGQKRLKLAEDTFVKKSARLVEILARNGRKDDAKIATESLKKFAEGKGFSDRLEKSIDAALKQKQPAPEPEVSEKETGVNARNVRFVMTTQKKGGPPMEVKCYYAEPAKMRVDMGESIVIMDLKRDKAVLLNILSRDAVVIKLSNVTEAQKKAFQQGGITRLGTWVLEAWKNPDADIKPVGEREIDGQKLVGVQFRGPLGPLRQLGPLGQLIIQMDMMAPMTIWADSKTQQPHLIEYNSKSMDPTAPEITMSKFEFDIELDDDLFSVEVPEGYVQTDQTLDYSRPKRGDLIASLFMYSAVFNGQFPNDLSAASTAQYKKAVGVEKLAGEDGQPPLAIMDEIQNFNFGTQFAQSLPADARAYYAGKGVAYGKSDQPIFWYWDGGEPQTWQVLGADLKFQNADSAPDVKDAVALLPQ